MAEATKTKKAKKKVSEEVQAIVNAGLAESAVVYAPLDPNLLGKIMEIPVADIHSFWDTRDQPGVITDELVQSIKAHGLIQEIRVTPIVKPIVGWQIVDGRRRFGAVQALEWKTIKGVVVPPTNESELEALSYAANAYTQGLSLWDNIRWAEKLASKNYKNVDIAIKMGKTEAYVSQLRGILKLPEAIVTAVKDSEITDNAFGKVRAIARLKEPALQLRMFEIAKTRSAPSITEIVSAYRLCTGEDTVIVKENGNDVPKTLKLAPEIKDIVFLGDLEPKSIEKIKALAKLRDFGQQFEMAKVLAKRTVAAFRAGELPPTLDELNDWITELKRQAALARTEEEDTTPPEPVAFEFKPLSAIKLTELWEVHKDKLAKLKKETDVDPLKVAELKGVIKGIKLAGTDS
jgi:ParB/RepB/Spo0J family partition protein